MKSILFIIGTFDSGGVSKSLLNLLNVFDKRKYHVSVLTISPKGIFQSLIPQDVRIITNPIMENMVNGRNGLLPLIKSGQLCSAFGIILRMCIVPFSRANAGFILSRFFPRLDEKFDVVIDYNGQQQLYYLVDKFNSCKKYTFFHSDYEKWPYYYKIDKKYFPYVDAIFTVSDICVNSLKKNFPNVAHKVFLMENISSSTIIKKMASESIEDMQEAFQFRFVTLGHVCIAKGSDLAIEVAALLKAKGLNFKWYFIGTISDETHYLQKCKDYGVRNNIDYIGEKKNPYPYINKSDLYIHPSQFEGKSIALDEAKLLCKPIVVTNFSTVHDQFEDGKNGSICEMNRESVASAIMDLIFNVKKRNSYINYLETHQYDNSGQVNKLYTLINK